jgi:hypothetical protein
LKLTARERRIYGVSFLILEEKMFRRDGITAVRGTMNDDQMAHEMVSQGLNAIPVFGGALSMISKFIPFHKKKKKRAPPPPPVQAPVEPVKPFPLVEEEEEGEEGEDE